ncbi:MAG: histidine phosphatase family protein [Actinomycetota bacterium]|nr:histidine phosphatase family protein [Actinomycetota bacterium]
MPLRILVRHAESTYNVEGRINGAPAIPVPLSARGRTEAADLGLHIAHVRVGLCLHTRFSRTIETARLALGDRAGHVPFLCEPLLDDINAGDLEGESREAYAAWIISHGRDSPFPGGESLDGAAARFADGMRSLADRPEEVVLAVCHELPVRYALNAASGSLDLEGPQHQIANATAYLFEPSTLHEAANGIERSLHMD